jgi:hypothetical protein
LGAVPGAARAALWSLLEAMEDCRAAVEGRSMSICAVIGDGEESHDVWSRSQACSCGPRDAVMMQ